MRKVTLLRVFQPTARTFVPPLLVLLLMGTFFGLIYTRHLGWPIVVTGAIAFPSFLALLVRMRRGFEFPNPPSEQVDLRCTEERIHIGSLVLSRKKIMSASITQFGDMIVVELKCGGMFGRKVFLRVDNATVGHELLDEMSLGVADTTARFWTQVALSGTRRNVSYAILVLIMFPGFFLLGSLGGWLTIFAWLFVVAQRVRVGADGIRIWWLFRERFIPFTSIADVGVIRSKATGNRVSLALHGGERLVIPEAVRYGAGSFQSVVLYSRIRAAWRHHSTGDDFAMTALAERPPSQSFASWVAHLRGLRHVAQHRRPAVLAEQLWRIVESPAAKPTERAAAAVALGADMDAPDRERMSAVAATLASDKLRIVLDAPDAEAAELEVLLQELEADHDAGRAVES